MLEVSSCPTPSFKAIHGILRQNKNHHSWGMVVLVLSYYIID
jgi:hypothetical protein